MSLCKRSNVWWIRLTYQGQRIQKSTGTSDKTAAQRFHDEFKASLWKEEFLNEKRDRTWPEAVVRWLSESTHKRSLRDDRSHLQWLDPHLEHLTLKQITRDLIDQLANLRSCVRRKKDQKEGVKPATVNRMLALIRAILRKAAREWEWLDREPVVRLRKEENHRVCWLTPEQAMALIGALPEHLAAMVEFSLATGLRQSNVAFLRWHEVDLERGHAWVQPDKAKAKKAIAIPLNADAIRILQRQRGQHAEYVFVYRSKPVKDCTTKAWYKALAKVGIQNFRWHDLRHTWASWHVQNGTTLQELQQLGAWASHEMVLRYAHLSSNHLKQAAERVASITVNHKTVVLNHEESDSKNIGTILAQSKLSDAKTLR